MHGGARRGVARSLLHRSRRREHPPRRGWPTPHPCPLPGRGWSRDAGPGEGRAEQKKRDRRLKKINEEIATLEERIAAAERERERNDLMLCNEEVYRDGERTKKIQAQNADLKAMIELLYGKWEALAKEKES
ncbi:MAG: hypothetical protein DMF59_03775 [Acidobacteria bacterium]|nr:MAG: hypothetical protein DMF59_03775 [Acidobacteriota bacterium]